MAKIGLEAILDMANFNRGMGQYNQGVDAMNGKTRSLGSILGGAGKAIAGLGVAAAGVAVGAIAGLAKGLWDCAKEAAEAEEAGAALDAVIKSTGRDMAKTRKMTDKYASSLQATTRYSDEQVMAAETILLQFETMNETVFPDAISLTADIAARLGVDMPEAAKLLGKALAEPGEGLARLKQAGITFTDAEEKAISAMYEAGDAAGAQSAILDKLKVSVGGAAVAAGNTYAGTIDRLKNSFSDIKERIGGPVLTALQSIADKVVSALGSPEVQAALNNITGWLEINLPVALDTAIAKVTTAYETVRPILERLGWVKPEAPKLEGVEAVKGPAGQMIDQAIGTQVAATGENIGKRFWTAFFDSVRKGGTDAEMGAANVAMNAIITEWLNKSVWQPIKDWFAKLWLDIKKIWTEGWQGIFGTGPVGSTVPNSNPVGGTVTQPALTGAGAGASGGPSMVTVGGDTNTFNTSDPTSFYLAQALVQDRKRTRWNAAMGVSS